MTSLTIRVMASPPRLARARELLGVLRAQAVTARGAGWVVSDPLMSVDERMRGARAGAADAWAAAGEATHHLVVQDDVLVCRGFVSAVAGAISAHPEMMISFCTLGTPRGASEGLVLKRRRDVLGAQALVFPAEVALDAANYLRSSEIPTDDQALTVYLQLRGKSILVVDPSLVVHDVSVPSLIGHDPILSHLQTLRLISSDVDAASLPWRTAPVVQEVF